MFQGKTLRLSALSAGIVELTFDRVGEAINKLDALTLNELGQAVEQIAADKTVKGVLLTSAKAAFIVGADIFEFSSTFSQDQTQLTEHNREQNHSFVQLANLPVPTVTAINGLALGGGFELTLATDYRVLGLNAQVGLPEVNLGLFPGLGGMARLPRLIAPSKALEWVISGRPQKADMALELGAVDEVAAEADLRDAALKLLGEAIQGKRAWRERRTRRSEPFHVSADELLQARNLVAKLHPQVPAPRLAIDLVERSAKLDVAQALLAEHAGFAQVAKTQAASALVQLFVNDQFLRKKAKEYSAAARPTAKAAVLGAGIMGGGIAYTSAIRGIPVLMKDIAQAALDLGTGEARKLLDKQVTAGKLPQAKAEQVLAAIEPTLVYQGVDQVDVVVEAVVENLGIKKKVLAEVESFAHADSVLASNTSSLSITELATALKRPQNFVGMHFFNPVPVMPLVEVIRGEQTSPVAAATIANYAVSMGKTPILVKDCPGFLVNRILTGNMVGFLRLIHDGADYRKVDAAMEAFGWPMGPAYLQDVVGMDTSVHVIQYITGGYGERLIPTYRHAVELMVEHKRFGQKNGVGFYRYTTDPKGRPIKTEAPDTAELLSSIQPGGPRDFSDAQIVDRIMLPMILEAARALEEGVAGSAIEVDMALILGVGFPRHVGGALKYADWLGLSEVVARCEHYASELGQSYAPTATLRDMAARNARFYD